MNETEVEYGGLTHSCNDPDCHIPGFVATLRRMSGPGDGWRPPCSCGHPTDVPAVVVPGGASQEETP